MAFAYNYFHMAKSDIQSDINVACITYENAVSHEDAWINNETVWVLGKKFSLPEQKHQFLNFVRSRLWFTYRKGFDTVGGTGITSDSGWGCMLRCGQMMLAQAFSDLTINKEWEWHPNCENQPLEYRKILKKFSDNRASCYSLHQIAQMGVQEGKAIGQWFGPNTISQSLRRLIQFDKDDVLVIHVAMDNTVVEKEVENLCYGGDCSNYVKSSNASSNDEHSKIKNPSTPWKPLVLIVPLRLGLSEINSVYFDHIKEVLKWKESIGIIGGKPNHAYYFIGSCNNSLIFLDPHTTQHYVKFPDVESGEAFEDDSYHCDCPSRTPLSLLDPSLAIGFLCPTKQHFENICSKVKSFKKTKTSLPLFEVLKTNPQCNVKTSRILSIKSHSRLKRKEKNYGQEFDDSSCLALDSDESLESDEEFEILELE